MLARIGRLREKSEGGFTLIELLVVMIIIGILVAIAIPTFLSQKTKAKETSEQADLEAIATDVNEYLVDGSAPSAGLTISGGAGSYTIASTPAVTGKLSPGNVVDAGSKIGADGSYCISVGNSDGNARHWFTKSAVSSMQSTTAAAGGC